MCQSSVESKHVLLHTIRMIYRKISTSLCFCFRFVTSTILHFYRHPEEWIECDWSFYATKQKKLPIKLVFINQFPCILGFVIHMFYWKFRFMIHILFFVFNHCSIIWIKFMSCWNGWNCTSCIHSVFLWTRALNICFASECPRW